MLENTDDKFRDKLNSGERIVWSGQPQQGLMLRDADALMIPFSICVSGFTAVWVFVLISNVPLSNVNSFIGILICSAPFVLESLYLLFGRFFVDMLQRSKTYYALTSEQIIIISGLLKQNVKKLNLKKLPQINVSATSNGKGTITFGVSQSWRWMYIGDSVPSNISRYYNIAPSFEMINDVKNIYEKIKYLQKEGAQ